MVAGKTVALFPEASFGAALNCVGIAQALRDRGARPVFICHPGFRGVFADHGFQEYHLESGQDLSEAERQNYWEAFVARHLAHFRLPPVEQIETYVAPTWEAIVDTAVQAETPLRRLLARLRPDAVLLDNVVMFPAIEASGIPWVRVVSCAETEIPDPLVPPYLSGCAVGDRDCHRAFAAAYGRAVRPAHERYNRFRAECGLHPCRPPLFLENSPYLNLLLSPGIVRLERKRPLDPATFVYLEGCVRTEAPFEPPVFPRHDDKPLAYVAFGSLGAVDVDLFRRLIAAFAAMPYRFLVNVGANVEAYGTVPDNVYLAAWLPQPSVLAQCDLFIHHGGNNSFCEALYFGVPSLVMPYCWDGHDNARRAEERGVGGFLPRYRWTADELRAAIDRLTGDHDMRRRSRANGERMRRADGAGTAAEAVLRLLDRTGRNR